MPTRWQPIRLGAVCTKIGSGATPRGGSGVYLENGPYALIRSQNVYNNGFSHDGLAYISEEHAAELANVEVLEGDVLLNITGDSVARACQVDPSVLPARVNQHVAIIRPDPHKLDPCFLRYFLVSPSTQRKLLSWAASGGTRNALTKGMIESLDVLAPADVAEQHAIAHILGTLDDKIELNRRRSRTLEAMARALFDSWFVHFDPAVVNALWAGHPVPDRFAERAAHYRERPDALGLPSELLARFPDRFVDSPLGPIPEGWGVRTVQRAVSTVGGATPSTTNPEYWNGGTIHWATPKDLSSSRSMVLLDTKRKITPEGLHQISSGLLPRGTLLLSSRAPVGYLAISAVPLAINQGYIAVPPGGEVSPIWMFFWCKRHMYEIKQRASGTTFLEIGKRNFRLMRLVVPGTDVKEAFDVFSESMIGEIELLERESMTLASLRDTLLPKLISGELRIEDAERFVAGVE